MKTIAWPGDDAVVRDLLRDVTRDETRDVVVLRASSAEEKLLKCLDDVGGSVRGEVRCFCAS